MIDLKLNAHTSASLPTATRQRLMDLCAWDFSKIRRRVAQRTSWPAAKVIRVEREYARFLALIIIDPDKSYGMAGPTDEFWHEHLLDTQDYWSLCQSVVGRFVHHVPTDAPETGDADNPDAYFDLTLPSLKSCFRGALSQVWPRIRSTEKGSKCGGRCSDVRQAVQYAI